MVGGRGKHRSEISVTNTSQLNTHSNGDRLRLLRHHPVEIIQRLLRHAFLQVGLVLYQGELIQQPRQEGADAGKRSSHRQRQLVREVITVRARRRPS